MRVDDPLICYSRKTALSKKEQSVEQTNLLKGPAPAFWFAVINTLSPIKRVMTIVEGEIAEFLCPVIGNRDVIQCCNI